jgi:hypothetical protein
MSTWRDGQLADDGNQGVKFEGVVSSWDDGGEKEEGWVKVEDEGDEWVDEWM